MSPPTARSASRASVSRTSWSSSETFSARAARASAWSGPRRRARRCSASSRARPRRRPGRRAARRVAISAGVELALRLAEDAGSRRGGRRRPRRRGRTARAARSKRSTSSGADVGAARVRRRRAAAPRGDHARDARTGGRRRRRHLVVGRRRARGDDRLAAAVVLGDLGRCTWSTASASRSAPVSPSASSSSGRRAARGARDAMQRFRRGRVRAGVRWNRVRRAAVPMESRGVSAAHGALERASRLSGELDAQQAPGFCAQKSSNCCAFEPAGGGCVVSLGLSVPPVPGAVGRRRLPVAPVAGAGAVPSPWCRPVLDGAGAAACCVATCCCRCRSSSLVAGRRRRRPAAGACAHSATAQLGRRGPGPAG